MWNKLKDWNIYAYLTCLPLFMVGYPCLHSWAIFSFYEWKSVGLQFAYSSRSIILKKWFLCVILALTRWVSVHRHYQLENNGYTRHVPFGPAVKWNPQLRKPGLGLSSSRSSPAPDRPPLPVRAADFLERMGAVFSNVDGCCCDENPG